MTGVINGLWLTAWFAGLAGIGVLMRRLSSPGRALHHGGTFLLGNGAMFAAISLLLAATAGLLSLFG